MNNTQKILGRCDTGMSAATDNGSVSTYLDTPRPTPAGFARNSGVSLGHYF